MHLRSFSELVQPAVGTLAFGFMRSLEPDEQARSVQAMVAGADLRPGVPQDLVDSFERLRSLFGYGLFNYEAFTAVEDLAWLAFEQALGERFVTYCDHEIQLTSRAADDETLTATTLEEVRAAFRRGGLYARGNWKVRLRSSGAPLQLKDPFRASYPQLLYWAREEGLLAGQQNKQWEVIQQQFRNWAAHPHRHLSMPSSVARTIHDLAEFINKLWGHTTANGRLYPSPIERELRVVGWPVDPDIQQCDEMYPTALANAVPTYGKGWDFILVPERPRRQLASRLRHVVRHHTPSGGPRLGTRPKGGSSRLAGEQRSPQRLRHLPRPTLRCAAD